MKCVQNKKTGEIKRVSDEQASFMTNSGWHYTSKSKWKRKVRDVK
jgi:hypothetical protein